MTEAMTLFYDMVSFKSLLEEVLHKQSTLWNSLIFHRCWIVGFFSFFFSCIWSKFNVTYLIFVHGLNLFFFLPSFSGLKQSEAESCYINIARTLDFYGVELHSGRVCLHCNISLGKCYMHILVDIYSNKNSSILFLTSPCVTFEFHVFSKASE